ncbi:fucose-binding lectin II [Sphingomonas bacterium]|uniref:fucose-binding lectin II n=1 Tax=Sphingomonas bacterium TaxID=1895847 RepID=UPI0015755E11|nr:fucose-binding lectin II [Sphingomonas bacterium]
MPNPIVINVPITQANTTLYIMADTYAAFTQQVSIQVPNGQPLVATGNGEGKRVGYWTLSFPTVGIYTFSVLVQYNSGSGYQNSSLVQQAQLGAVTLNQIVVFSEDANDNDDNDCLITFMWFNRPQAARQ